METVRDAMEREISEASFVALWDQHPLPPYEMFIDFVTDRITPQVSAEEVCHIQASIRSEGPGRARIDGCLGQREHTKEFYVEVVWLPKLERYRGQISVWEKSPEPKHKTIEQFTACLDAILHEDKITLEGQIFDAAEGVDTSDEGFAKSYDAIFRLFERFPEEMLGAPCILARMVVARGGHESELGRSLDRKPSVNALMMVDWLLSDASLSLEQRDRWMRRLQSVAESTEADEVVREEAREYIAFQQTQNSK